MTFERVKFKIPLNNTVYLVLLPGSNPIPILTDTTRYSSLVVKSSLVNNSLLMEMFKKRIA